MNKYSGFTTIRFTEAEKRMIAELKSYHNLSSDNAAVRFALKVATRVIERESPKPIQESSEVKS